MSAPTGNGLAGRRVLVVGASAGIGRAFAQRVIAGGASVVVVGRRAERLAELVEGAATAAVVAGDVRAPSDCARIVRGAAVALGEIDLVLYCAGSSPLRPLAQTTADDWATVLETHVLGVHHVVQEALRHMPRHGVVAVLSSETVGRPRYGLGAYGASKAALDQLLQSLRVEHPRTRFTTVAVGATFPTEFGDGFDPDVLDRAVGEWARHGLMTESMMDPDEVAATLVGLFGAALDNPGVGVEHLVLRPSSPVLGSVAAAGPGEEGEPERS
jgi:NAD(P)-dependent dehydrogenase (short-subunit alcohol dehydrogenase family)